MTPAAWLILAVIGAGLYANSLKVPFTFDDHHHIPDNPHIRLQRLALPDILQITSGASANGPAASRPVAMFTFALQHYFQQTALSDYHGINIFIHIINAWLIFSLARLTLRRHRTEVFWPALGAAVLWLVHPLHTQSVTYIIQRMNCLATLFYLLTFWCYLKGRLTARDRPGRRFQPLLFYLGAAVAVILGLGTKPIAATIPLTLFLYEWYFFQDLQKDWLKQHLVWPGIALGAFFLVAVFYLGPAPIEGILASYEKQAFDLPQRLLTQNGVLLYYLSLLVFPHPARLNLDHDFPVYVNWLTPATALLAGLALVALFTAAIRLARKHRLASFALIWFGLTLAIESTFMGLALANEHRTYLPLIFPVICGTWLLQQHLGASNRLLAIVLILVCATVWGNWTIARNRLWQDRRLLWQDSAQKAPDKYRPLYGLGAAYLDRQNYAQAIFFYKKALQKLSAQDLRQPLAVAQIYNDLGAACGFSHQLEQAICYLKKALATYRTAGQDQNQRKIADTCHSLGYFYYQQKGYARAQYWLEQTLFSASKTKHHQAHYLLGTIFLDQKKYIRARYHFVQTLKMDPEFLDIRLKLAYTLLLNREPAQARPLLQKVLARSPNNSRACNYLGIIYYQNNQLNRAGQYFQRALKADPGYAAARHNLNKTLARLQMKGKFKHADPADTFFNWP